MSKKTFAAIPAAKELKGRVELAYGEVTGHAHRMSVSELFETKNGELYLKTEKLDRLTHEEHKPVELTPGNRHVCIKRAYSGENAWENVRD